MGIDGPTLADLSAKVSKSITALLALIMMPTVGLHTGVTGTDAAANKIDDMMVCLLNEKMSIIVQNYKITQAKAKVFNFN
jgi:hypothetical protein